MTIDLADVKIMITQRIAAHGSAAAYAAHLGISEDKLYFDGIPDSRIIADLGLSKHLIYCKEGLNDD